MGHYNGSTKHMIAEVSLTQHERKHAYISPGRSRLGS